MSAKRCSICSRQHNSEGNYAVTPESVISRAAGRPSPGDLFQGVVIPRIVHRNWLAITHNLPLSKWYYDTTSEWTLDYPPFFAYFSYLLTLPAHYLLPSRISSKILELSATPIETWATVVYMRTTVLISELVLLWALLRLAQTSSHPRTSKFLALSLFLHPGFLILDSIHFQYNAFLFGLMAWSLVGAREGRPLMCAGFFAGLLMFKHIYVYQAPAWFIYLFRGYCFPPGSRSLNFPALLRIALITLLPLLLALAPFVFLGGGGLGQVQQLLTRLFPFTRGLMHAYWAPNIWALVALTDRILLKASPKLPFLQHLPISQPGVASTSRGLVGDTRFAILPDIKPVHCFVLTGISQIILLIPLTFPSSSSSRHPSSTYKSFLRAIVHCGFASFMFGWHVHEKAVMLVLVPLTLLAVEDYQHFRIWLICSVAGIYSLFPLLFHAAETPIKVGYSLIWLIVVGMTLRKQVKPPANPSIFAKGSHHLINLYLLLTPLYLLLTTLLPPLLLTEDQREKWEFLPLMGMSVWCALGLVGGWVGLLVVGDGGGRGKEGEVRGEGGWRRKGR